jgi:chromosome segregation ATPase
MADEHKQSLGKRKYSSDDKEDPCADVKRILQNYIAEARRDNAELRREMAERDETHRREMADVRREMADVRREMAERDETHRREMAERDERDEKYRREIEGLRSEMTSYIEIFKASLCNKCKCPV